MCGLVYMHNTRKKPVSGKIIKRYMNQRSRGTEGFGIYRPLYDKMAHNPQERRMLKHMRKLNDPILMFHHRNPTSPRANVLNACHPFSTKDFFEDEYILMHNGMVTNKQALYDKHTKMGIKYVSLQPDGKEFCDSECLLWEVALYLEGKQDKLDCYGSIAFILYKKDKTGKNPALFFGRNSSPLVMKHGKTNFVLASVGDGKSIDSDQLYKYDYVSGELSKTKLEIPSWQKTTSHLSSPGSTSSNFHGPYSSPITSPATASGAYTPGSHAARTSSHTSASDDSKSYVQPPFSSVTTTQPTSRTIKVSDTPSLVSHIPTAAEKLEKEYALTIKRKYKEYLDNAKGVFDNALFWVLEDLEELEAQAPEDAELLRAVYEMIDEDDNNISRDSIHPDYLTDHFPHLTQMGFKTTNKEDENNAI
jgi:hypothetical protein